MHIKLNKIGLTHGTQTILQDINIDIPPGCRLALIGASGAGKSTIVSLIRRDLDPTKGQVLLDGNNLTSYNLTSVLNYIGVIPQKPDILSGTVRENVLHGLQDICGITDKDIWCILNAISPEFQTRFKKFGLDTKVGKQGMRLSGGEQQRLCVARALIENPKYPKQLLLVDEATSSLDSDTEVTVQQGIDITLDRGMSAVVVAHRFSTLRNCNKFIYLRKIDNCLQDEEQVAMTSDSLGDLYENLPEFRKQANLQGFLP